MGRLHNPSALTSQPIDSALRANYLPKHLSVFCIFCGLQQRVQEVSYMVQ